VCGYGYLKCVWLIGLVVGNDDDYYSLVGCLVGVFVVLVGGARQFSLENARAIAVNKSPEQRA
jgi:hypothetical protein